MLLMNNTHGAHMKISEQAIQEQTTAADLALDTIESLPQQIGLLISKAAYDHDLTISKKDTAHAMLLIKEALDDLFARDRVQLIDAAPIRSTSIDKAINGTTDAWSSLENTINKMLRPFPQNPSTIEMKGGNV